MHFAVVVTDDTDAVHDVNQGVLETMGLVRRGSYLPHPCFNYVVAVITHLDVVDK